MQELELRIKLEALISERYGMLASNQARADHGYAQAYGEEAFRGNAEEMRFILKQFGPTEGATEGAI